MPEPRYDNNCEDCRFVGADGEFDLYVCPNVLPLVVVFGPGGDEEDAALADLYDASLDHEIRWLPQLRLAAELGVAAGHFAGEDLPAPLLAAFAAAAGPAEDW